LKSSVPLAERLRPKSLADYVGQQHLIGRDGVLRRALQAKNLPSLILWGPPGVGKTTLAHIMALELNRPFYALSAINAGVKEIREVIEKASAGGLFTEKPVLFVDEIHRFSKAQQDSLLGAVETGKITLIGATTENPSFEVIAALLSRCQVYILRHLSNEEMLGLLTAAITKDTFLKGKKILLTETDALIRLSGGDARRLLNVFELVIDGIEGKDGAPDSAVEILDAEVANLVQQNPLLYDKTGDNHYDVISAFIKSIRGSDPNGAVYWLARMVEGGEDPVFIARRLLIAASEDIGNANPTALVVATACFQAVGMLGYPEARITLAQAATYLATSPKSNSAYAAINKAQGIVRETGSLAVPLHLRNAPTQLMRDAGHGQNYQYAHDHAGGFVQQEYLPDEISGRLLYEPGANARERETREALKKIWGDKYGY
jgi:putative ATPase